MKRINRKSAMAILTACLVLALALTLVFTSASLKNNGGGMGIASNSGVAETAIITDAAKDTAALADGEVPAGYSAAGTSITTGAEFLQYFTNDLQNGVYVLANDIELSYTPPKGTSSGTTRLRSGVTLDGQGHTIKLMYSSTSRTGIGYQTSDEISGNMGYLFDYVSGTIKNLNVRFNGQTINNQFNNTGHWCGIAAGVICAKLYSAGVIENSSVTLNAKITLYNWVSGSWNSTAWTDIFFGAFAGMAQGTLRSCTTIVDDTTFVNVYAGAGSKSTTKARFGGLVGMLGMKINDTAGSIFNCAFKNTRTVTTTYLQNDGSNKVSGFAIGSAEKGGSINGFIYYSNFTDMTGIINTDSKGLVSGIATPSSLKNVYANKQVTSFRVVGTAANQGCVNLLKTADSDNIDIYFDKANAGNIVFKLKDSYASDGIIWSITHGKNGAADTGSLKDVSGSLSRCVSIPKYDGGVKRDQGTDITVEYGTYTTLNITDAAVTYSNAEIDARANAAASLANGAAKSTDAFNILYNGAAALPKNAGSYAMTAPIKVEGTSIVYYDAAARVAAKLGTTGTLIVNRYNLTMAAGGNYYTISEKVYDGSYDHTSGVTGSIEGVNGEVIRFIIDEAYFITGSHWTGDAHTVASANVADAVRLRIEHHMDSPNYTVNGLSDDLTQARSLKWTESGVSIAPRNIAVDAGYFSVADKVYDGTADASVTAIKAVNGVNGDVLTLTDLAAAFNSKNVTEAATVTITFKNSNTNYRINNTAANTAISITIAKTIAPKRLTVTFGENVVQSYRDKSAIDTISCVITDGLLAGDSANVTGVVTGTVDFTRFGRYPLTAAVGSSNYYSSDTSELIMVYFKSGAAYGKWLIESFDDFIMINDNEYYLGLDYVQTADIDAYYAARDNINGVFGGNYDGGGHTIKNLIMVADTAVFGLFESVSGSVSNLTVAGASVNSYNAGASVGGIAGEIKAGGALNGTAFIGDIYVYGANSAAGGIAGVNGGLISAGAAIGELLTVGDGCTAGGVVGNNTGSITSVTAFMIAENKGSSENIGVITGANSGTVETSLAAMGFAVKNGVKSGSGSSVRDMLASTYKGASIAELINAYRNRLGINVSAGVIDISNVNELNIIREYRYLQFRLTADITLHIDSVFVDMPTIVGGFDSNGFKIYSTDGITKTEIQIA